MPGSTAISERRSQSAKASLAGRARDAKGHLLPRDPAAQAATDQPPQPLATPTPTPTTEAAAQPAALPSSPEPAGGVAPAAAPFHGRGLARLRERRQRSTL